MDVERTTKGEVTGAEFFLLVVTILICLFSITFLGLRPLS